jgi:hypothetical protein
VLWHRCSGEPDERGGPLRADAAALRGDQRQRPGAQHSLPTASPLRPCANESRCSPARSFACFVALFVCLLACVRPGRLQAVEILLSLAACVNASDARKGISALHCAADRGVPSVVDLLLSFQADVNK